jgi:hypothetical protein
VSCHRTTTFLVAYLRQIIQMVLSMGGVSSTRCGSVTHQNYPYSHTFEWKREQCFLIRKPDPPVLVAITKEPPGKIRSTLVQILDYNLMRFDIMDRKGMLMKANGTVFLLMSSN